MTRYFSYGANMDPVQMAERCPSAIRIGSALLDQHRFAIAAGGFGTVHSAAGHRVHGVVWQLTPPDLAALDAFEGVAEGFYRKGLAEVVVEGGKPEQAMFYCAADGAPGVPSPGYLENIIEVAEALGFPADYLAGLRSQRVA